MGVKSLYYYVIGSLVAYRYTVGPLVAFPIFRYTGEHNVHSL